MKKIFAAPAVLSLVTGAAALTAPAHASSTWLVQGSVNEGTGG